MGLRCTVDPVNDLNFPPVTPVLCLYIDYSEGCDAFLDTFFNIVYDLCPVDTGELISSIDGFTDREGVEVYADADYAQYVEYGTSKMEAQPYFRPAIAAAFDVAKRKWQEAYTEAMAEERQILKMLFGGSDEEGEEGEEGEEEEGDDLGGLAAGMFQASASSQDFWTQMTGIMMGFGYVWGGGGFMGIIGGFVLGLATAFVGGFFMFLEEEQAKANIEMEANTKRGKPGSQYSGDSYADLYIEIY